ncbi:MAG: hypothetical protein V7731_06540 [Amphritea sp.]
MHLRSGISKELKRQFVVDEDALIRIKSVFDKAAQSLDRKVQVVFHVEREDDRFYETHDLDDVISDPNISGKKITFLIVEMREEESKKDSRRDWIARVVFLAEKRYGIRFKDTDEIHIDISTNDKNWALLLADELEPQIERTVNRSKLPRWPLYGTGAFLLYFLVKFIFSVKDKFSEETIELVKPLTTVVIVMAFLFLTITFMFWLLRGRPTVLAKLLGPETSFLWGDEAKHFREREQTRKNLFWGVVVAFVVSAMAGIGVTIL